MPVPLIASLPAPPLVALIAAGVLARIGGGLVGAGSVLPALTLPTRVALAALLTAVALPAALAAGPTFPGHDGAALAAAGPAILLPLIVGEALVGLAMGAAAAAVAGAGGWAGSLLGSAAGLSWADDFTPDADAQAAGVARLAWWISCGAFLAAGGLGTIAAGLVDSLRIAPVGLLLPVAGGAASATLVDLATRIPAAALALALALAVPALVAVLAMHLTVAICVRTVPFLPGQGVVQALAAVALLAAVSAGAEGWVGGFAALVQGPLERSFDIR